MLNTPAMCFELAVSMPAILRGDDPIDGRPEAFYPARVQRFEAMLANYGADGPETGAAG